MRRLPLHSGLAALAAAVALIGVAMPRDLGAARRDAPKRGHDARAADAARSDTLASHHQPADENWVRLGRAVAAMRARDLRGVVESLEALDPAAEASWSEADRAAFLLGEAYLGLGDVERFRALARAIAAWDWESPYTRWLAFELGRIDAESSGAATDSAAAATAADSTRTTHAAPAAADSARAAWERIARADTTSVLGRDLAGAALIRRATSDLAGGGDPRATLDQVPAGSRYAARARHVAALATLERGDSTAGEAMLRALADEESTYAARREVLLALGGRALERADWPRAFATYREIEGDWTAERDTLRRLLDTGAFAPLWTSWRADAALSSAVLLDGAAAESAAARLAVRSLDLTTRPAVVIPAPDAPARAPAFRWAVSPPPPEAWRALAASARALDETRGALERTRWDAARERETLDTLRRYLGAGLDRAHRETTGLEARAALLDSVTATLDLIDARLRHVRDEATRRVLVRSAELLRGCMNDLLWLGGMRLISIDGPYPARAVAAPAGYHAPDVVVAQEEVLVRAIRAVAERMALDAPGRIALSYEKHWRPGMIDRALAQAAETHRALAWARALGVAIDSSIAATAGSDSLRRLEARLAGLAHAADSLARAHAAARDAEARRAVERTLAMIEPEREAIDYGLATAAYGQSVRLGAATPAAAGSDSLFGDPELTRWRGEAIRRLRAFLDRHPESFARGEMRFRLADLMIIEDRQAFRAAMDRAMAERAAGRVATPLPVLTHAEPLALYRKILTEDPGFEHRDAARFDAAMILADQGSPEAAKLFTDLVAETPHSAYAQESWLRLGDIQFDGQRYRESVALYAHAATAGDGADPTLRAMALYKMGWAHYNDDRFLDAADAFRSVLDLYAAEPAGAIQVEIASEAEAYLVHSLAGAGGAAAFAAYFDRVGPRPYETRVLMAMAQQDRRLACDGDAIKADELMIARYPKHADALVTAERLIATRAKTAKPADVRETRIAYAPRFAPGSDWFAAQASDSVRRAGADFARNAWVAAAKDHHRIARERHSRDDWRQALALYENVLSRWPEGDEAATLELAAGEAGEQLGDYPAALKHYMNAARSGPDSVAAQAMWQRVAATDAWYETMRPAGRTVALDSLARAVMTSSDELMARFPDHPRAAELLWREGNLAFAHGWYEDAAGAFGKIGERHPRDAHAPRAAILRADALYRLGTYDQAGTAYEAALAAARTAGVDSLARRAALASPVAWYRHAESAVAADSNAHAQHAALFEQVASRWPDDAHAPVAQYRAGLAWRAAGKDDEAARAMETLIARFPNSEFVKDAHLQVARIWESAGHRERSADAYARFAERYPADSSAGNATLKAADLYAAAGLEPRADRLRLAYVAKHPDDVEGTMEIMEALARRDLASLGARPISTLLPADPPSAGAPAAAPKRRGAKAAAARAKNPDPPSAGAPATPASHLAAYMALAEAHPRLAARDLEAQVRFLEGEEALAATDTLPLRQPLAASITAHQKQLDRTIALYRACVAVGIGEWTHAATFRI
ncbi:MAG: tetratricopeptide repeat protein [Candidatus Eisenbacteria bacterium]|nr:tetratricopeptide repeat protein [Candidatus Eisenbacteria bacterium]